MVSSLVGIGALVRSRCLHSDYLQADQSVTGREVLAAAAWQRRALVVWPRPGLAPNGVLGDELLKLFLRQAALGIARLNSAHLIQGLACRGVAPSAMN